MAQAIATIIGAFIALASAIIAQIMQNRLGKKRTVAINYVRQFASFYELEKLYVSEISRLRKLAGENDNAQTIKNTFRKQNEANGWDHIEQTSSSAKNFAEKLEKGL